MGDVIAGAATLAVAGGLAFGAYTVFNGAGADAAPAHTVETVVMTNPGDLPPANGLAAEQEAAAAAEVARLAAEAAAAEAARVAAEQAAAQAEADRIAQEQAAQQQAEEAVYDEPTDEEPTDGAATWVPSDDPNVRDGGTWDTSGCASGRFESDANGTPICVG